MRIGVIRGGMEVEIWKNEHIVVDAAQSIGVPNPKASAVIAQTSDED
jgi:hypothetical protein